MDVLNKLGLSVYLYYLEVYDMDQVDLRLLLQNSFLSVYLDEAGKRILIALLFPREAPGNVYFNWLVRSKRNVRKHFKLCLTPLIMQDFGALFFKHNFVLFKKLMEKDLAKIRADFKDVCDVYRVSGVIINNDKGCLDEYEITKGCLLHSPFEHEFYAKMLFKLKVKHDLFISLNRADDYIKQVFSNDELKNYNPLFNLIDFDERGFKNSRFFDGDLQVQYPKL